MEERITELETRISYQDRYIAELDDVVRAFALRVEKLESELAQVRNTLVNQPSPFGSTDEPPPHY